MNGETIATPTPTPDHGMSEKTKTQLIIAVVSGIVSIVVAIITASATVLVAIKTGAGDIEKTKSNIAQAQESATNLQAQVDQIRVPVGTIVPYGGPIDVDALKKAGWLVCNGDPVSRNDYKDLFNVIGVSWGDGNRVGTFSLPDLRGVFLRGVNGARNDIFHDPDADQRTNGADGGNSKNTVGSFQMDEFRTHTHVSSSHNNPPPLGKSDGNHSTGKIGPQFEAPWLDLTAPSGGNETRPKNACVYYLIKY